MCDSVASHAKKGLSSFQRDEETPLNSPEEIIDVIKQIKNHTPDIAETCSFEEKFKTFDGIRSCHKFKFTETEALGYSKSSDQNPSQVYQLSSESFSFLLE